MDHVFRGRLFSGIGKGRYYVGHPEYQKRFESSLGYRPYPGTLNLKLEDPRVVEGVKSLRSKKGIMIASFVVDGEGFSALKCFDGKIRGEKVTLLFIDVTHYNESVAEIISPTYLRGALELKDGDEVEFSLDVPDSIQEGL